MAAELALRFELLERWFKRAADYAW